MTDEQLNCIKDVSDNFADDDTVAFLSFGQLRALITRLEAAERALLRGDELLECLQEDDERYYDYYKAWRRVAGKEG